MTTILMCTTGMLLFLYYRFDKPMTVGLVLGTVCIMAGAQVYSLSGAINDIEYLFGILMILVGMLYAWEAFTSYRTGRKEDREEWLVENLDELQDDYEDALDNEDYALAAKISNQIKEARAKHDMFALKPENNIRQKVQEKQNRKYWKQFDDDGKL